MSIGGNIVEKSSMTLKLLVCAVERQYLGINWERIRAECHWFALTFVGLDGFSLCMLN